MRDMLKNAPCEPTRKHEMPTSRKGISTDDLAVLQQVPLFAGLPQSELSALLANCSVRCFSEHTPLFVQGEEADCFFIVLEGWAKLYRLCEDGQEVVISIVSRGESFAEAAIFDNNIYPVSAMTVTDCRLLVVNADPLIKKLRENIDLAFNMLGSLSRRMRMTITTLHQLSAMSSTERVADFFLELCNGAKGEVVLNLPIDKSLIAARLGMQPETFSRSLAKLKDHGVTSAGCEITINNVDALEGIIKRSVVGCR